MITCPKCSVQINNNSKFCRYCGAEIEQIQRCPKCSSEVEAGEKFCGECGANLSKGIVKNEPIIERPVFETKTSQTATQKSAPSIQPTDPPLSSSKPAKKPRKALLFGGVALAVVAVIVIAVELLNMFGNDGDYVLYIANNEIYIANITNGASWQLTENMISEIDDAWGAIDLDGSFDDLNIYQGNTRLDENIAINYEKKLVFYLDRMTYNGSFLYGGSLYCRNISSPDSAPTKIASNVDGYYINSDVSQLTIMVANPYGDYGWTLYIYDIEKDLKQKIADEVTKFVTSKDGNIVYFCTVNNELFIKENGKESEKIDSGDWLSIYGITDDAKSIYYHLDDCAYKKTLGQKKSLLASNIDHIESIDYDTDEVIYYNENWNMISTKTGVIQENDYCGSSEHLYGPNGQYSCDPNEDTLRYNGEIVDYNVFYYDIQYVEATDELFYITDGVLKVCKNGVSTRIANDVYRYHTPSYFATDDGTIYFDNPSGNYYRPKLDMHFYSKGKDTLIATDVDYDYVYVTSQSSILYCPYYDFDNNKGNLYCYQNGESILIAADICCPLEVGESYYKGNIFLQPTYGYYFS